MRDVRRIDRTVDDRLQHFRLRLEHQLAERLEALALGTPAIVSSLAAVRSWAGGAVEYVEPNDAEALASTMVDVARGSVIDVRLGQELAREYRWANCAAALAAF